MRVDQGDPKFQRLMRQFAKEGNPRVLWDGTYKWTKYEDDGQYFFIRTDAPSLSATHTQNSVGKSLTPPRKEPELK